MRHSPLVVIYFCMVASAALSFDRHLVWLVTAACVLSYEIVVVASPWCHPELAQPPFRHTIPGGHQHGGHRRDPVLRTALLSRPAESRQEYRHDCAASSDSAWGEDTTKLTVSNCLTFRFSIVSFGLSCMSDSTKTHQQLIELNAKDANYAIKFVDQLLTAARLAKASDVHLQPTQSGWTFDGDWTACCSPSACFRKARRRTWLLV